MWMKWVGGMCDLVTIYSKNEKWNRTFMGCHDNTLFMGWREQ